jgi:hypothetical protein
MSGGAVVPQRACKREEGSALLLMLFICLATATVLQAASTALLFAERAAADESVGRQRLQEKDEILSGLAVRAAGRWGELPWSALATGEGALAQIAEDEEWLLTAQARQDEALSIGETSVWAERGRDGLDLPLAAVVAETMTGDAGRVTPWVGSDVRVGPAGESLGSDAGCFLARTPEGILFGPECMADELEAEWHLSGGWLALSPDCGAGGGMPIAGGEGAIFLSGRAGHTCSPPSGAVGPGPEAPAETAGSTPETPALVVMSGGGTLDLRGHGDIYAVVVVDDGSVLLEGTTVHGAVFATDTVDVGAEGQILFAKDVLRWATDRSLSRVRLVPGTRWESMD